MTSPDKFILITGCSSGIGLCAAKTLQARGYKVIASARKDVDLEMLETHGFEHVVKLDLRSTNSIDTALEKVKQISNGRLFALFNNAAYGQPGAVEDLSREALRLQFETNVFGTHELTVKAIPLLLKCENSRIVQNSSVLGFMAMPMRGAYVASKFALEGLSDALRLELSETQIKISIIEPGPIATNFRANALVALQENIEFSGSRHKSRYEGALARLKKTEATSRFTLPPEAVIKRLIHALESSRPKARYYVTFPTYLFAFLRHFLPTTTLDKIALMAAKGEG